MPVVSNTSPVLNLAIIGQIDLLHSQFGEVLIPPGVRDELRLETALPGTAAIKQAIEMGWLQVHPLKETRMVDILTRNLDRGEAEAISLAIEQGMSAILLDESEGRATAKSLGLEPMGDSGNYLEGQKKRRGSLSWGSHEGAADPGGLLYRKIIVCSDPRCLRRIDSRLHFQ